MEGKKQIATLFYLYVYIRMMFILMGNRIRTILPLLLYRNDVNIGIVGRFAVFYLRCYILTQGKDAQGEQASLKFPTRGIPCSTLSAPTLNPPCGAWVWSCLVPKTILCRCISLWLIAIPIMGKAL